MIDRTLLLRLHRWTTLVFALPLAAVILTGAILSVEPILQRMLPAGTPALATVEAALLRVDPQNRARSLAIRANDGSMTVQRAEGGAARIDLSTGSDAGPPGALAEILLTSRRLHETLLLDLGWLVVASTWAMLVIALLGILMGLPRLKASLAGWHKGIAWFVLPLVILSPLTGLAIAYGVTFIAPAERAAGTAPANLLDAVRIVAREHDLSRVVWIRPRGRGLLARVWDGQELRTFLVTREGLSVQPRNLPRALHEGNVAGVWSAGANVITSAALIGLLGTGLVLWGRRQFRPRRPRTAAAVPGE